MFDPGTKIVLLESSQQKAIGPRRGSIGYVSNCYNTRTFSLITNGFESLNVVASICEVYFIRYGFEKQGRIERKAIVSIMPVIKKNENSDVHKQIKELLQKVSSSKDAYLWSDLREQLDASPSSAVAVATTLENDHTDLSTCDKIEFSAWIQSYLNNKNLSKLINHALVTNHFTTSHDAELHSPVFWNEMRRVVNERQYRTDFVETWSENIESRKICIQSMRKLCAIEIRTRIKEAAIDSGNIKHMDDQEVVLRMYDMIGMYLFNTIIFKSFMYTYKKIGSIEVTSAVEDVESLISECLSLSSGMLKANSGFGYTLSK